MKAKATITAVGMKPGKEASGYSSNGGTNPVLTLSLDIPIPDATLPKSWEHWWDRLDWNPKERACKKYAEWEAAHAAPAPEEATGEPEKGKGKRKAKSKPATPHVYSWNPPKDHPALKPWSDQYDRYVDETHASNATSYKIAKEAGVFLLLLKKQVRISIETVQQMFTALLTTGSTAHLGRRVQAADEAPETDDVDEDDLVDV